MPRHSTYILILCLTVLLAPMALFGQGVQASLSGRVVDSSGAAVPNVAIQIRNTGTNQLTPVVADGGGNYSAPVLQPGNYTITVEAPGFKKFVREGLVLNINQSVAVDIALEVGGVTETVTVSGEAPLIETTKADRGGVIDKEQVHELPLNGRNPFMLAKLVAGVNFNGQIIWERPFDNGAIANWSINGGRASTNEFLLDGAPNNAMAGSNNIAYVPPVDSVQEFKIQTNSFDAQYGHTGGGIINVSLKGGTNSLHGAVYEFARRKAWDTNSFQNNAQGKPKDAHYLDQWGYEVDGPIYIPKIYDGRNKSFFMYNYEGYREGTPRPQTLSVPATEFLNGDFSKNVDGKGALIPIYDPTTGRLDASGKWIRDAFAGNQIPANRLNPIAKNILSYFPAPNTRTSGVDYTSQNYFFNGADALDKDRFYNVTVKLDQQFGSKNHVFFRAGSNDRTQMAFDNSNAIIGPGARGSLPEKRINDAYVLDWVGVLSPRTVANVRVSFARYLEQDRGDQNAGFDLTKLGFPASLVSQIPGGSFFGSYNISDYQNLGQYPSGSITNTWAIAGNVSRTQGPHTLKAGVDLRWIQYIATSLGNPLNLSTDRVATQKDYTTADGSGNTIASFLLGTLSSGSSDLNALPTYMYRYFAPWVQDDWRVSKRLTLNLGLRWDFNIPANERYNRLNRGFDLNATNPVDKLIDRTKFPGFPTVKGALLFAGVDGQSRIPADTYMKALQPRVGAAYQITSKLVLRGGWGRYYSNPSNSYLQNVGFNNSTTVITSPDSGRSPFNNLLSNPFPTGLQLPTGSSLGALTFLGKAISFVKPDFKLPRVDQFSFGFQYELPRQSKIEASYVGNRSTDLQSNVNINTYDLAFRKQCNLMEGGNPLFCDQTLPNPFQGLAPFLGTSLYTNATLPRSTLANPYPAFGNLTQQMRNDGKVWYNSLQLTYEMRLRGDLNILASYTLSKSMDQDGSFLDYQNNVLQRSVSQYDRPHSLSVATVYSLPFGKGKHFLNSHNGVVDRIVGGWQTTLQLTYASGLPWALPNVIYVKDATIPNIDWSAPIVQGVKPCVAQQADNGSIALTKPSVTAGCTDYNFLIASRFTPTRFAPLRDPRLRMNSPTTADLSLTKMTVIKERMRLQFRAEAFNLANTYWFGRQQFNATATNAAFGTITKSTIAFTNTNQPRYIQLALKFLW